MKNHISGIEKKILTVLQEGLPISQTPYKDMAQEIGIEVSELLSVLKDWQKQGKLPKRYIGMFLSLSMEIHTIKGWTALLTKSRKPGWKI